MSLGKTSHSIHEYLSVKQSGFMCCWSFDDYMADGQTYASKASQAFSHASGIAATEDLKALAARAAQHTTTAQQLGSLASKEL